MVLREYSSPVLWPLSKQLWILLCARSILFYMQNNESAASLNRQLTSTHYYMLLKALYSYGARRTHCTCVGFSPDLLQTFWTMGLLQQDFLQATSDPTLLLWYGLFPVPLLFQSIQVIFGFGWFKSMDMLSHWLPTSHWLFRFIRTDTAPGRA